MDKKQTSPEPSQAELLPTQEEQVPANPPSRKRQIAVDSDDDKPQPKRARLTRKNLALFDKMGKKKDSQDSTTASQKTKTTSTTISGFADQAYKNCILPPRHSKPPANLKDIQERHSRSRATASPTESEYKRYTNKVGRAPNEATMVVETSRRMLKDYDDEGYHQSFNQSFTGFPEDVGFNDGLSAPQPDFVEGLEKREYDPFPVDEHVSGAVLYDDDPDSLALPHVAGEWKGRGRNMEEARLQSSYDGAALVYARGKALSHMGKSDPPGHAEVTTFTTDGTTLNLFAHYAAETEDGTLEYHQHRIKSTNLIDSHEDFKDGYKQLRNAQDHARNQSYALRDDLREHWKQQRSTLQPITEGTSLPVPDSQANPYEDEADYEVVDQPHPTRRSSSRHSSSKHSTGHSSSKHSSSKSSHQTPSSDGHKRKASQPPPLESGHASKHSSRHKSYWKKDAMSGCYYHRYSDGTVSWLDDDEEDECD
ncbi:hypothetical protein F5Y11DRAFT_328373 [Daldinia sp. FL1419]|nr:hypothetical protein F5Y11DRAFT_328373 [Daldinia sp. FL1419]